jgi:hypothetical protein
MAVGGTGDLSFVHLSGILRTKDSSGRIDPSLRAAPAGNIASYPARDPAGLKRQSPFEFRQFTWKTWCASGEAAD